MKHDALESYRHEMLVWASMAPHSRKKIDPPKPPAILKA